MILLKLPIKDILLNANRVCRHWKTIIKNSPRLQQALFFSPLQSNTAEILRREYEQTSFRRNQRPHAPFVVENPFYVVLMNRSGPWRHTSKKRREIYGRKDASWRRMLLCQPPIKATFLSASTLKVENAGGIKFQDIEDAKDYGRNGLFEYLPEICYSDAWLSVEEASMVKSVAEGDKRGVVEYKIWWD